MNSSTVGTSLYLSMDYYKSWSCIFLANISASWLIFITSMLCCNWANCSMVYLFTLAFFFPSCFSSCAILSSFSFHKKIISIALSMLAVAYAPVKCENVVNFSVKLEGIYFQTMSIISF